MSFDLVIGIVVLVFAVAGLFSGALRQLVQLLALGAGWAAARFLAPGLVEPIFGAHPVPWQRSVTALGCFAAAALLTGVVGRRLARELHGPDGTPGLVDRTFGGLIGAAKGVLLCWVLLSALALAHGPLVLGPVRIDPRGARTAAFAARHNLVQAADPLTARKVEKLLELVRDPAARKRLLHDDAGLRRLFEDPRFKALLERGAETPEKLEELSKDPELQSALEELARRGE